MFKKIRAYQRVSYHFTYLSNAEAALAMETVSVFLQLAVQLQKMDGKKIDLNVVTTHVVGTLIFEEYLPWDRVRPEYAESAARACLFAQAAARVRPAYV